MSKEYQYNQITGSQWTRAKRIVIENPLGELPHVKFVEEQVVNLSEGDQFQKDRGVLAITPTLENMVEQIPVLDVETGADTGECITYQQLNAYLKSVYIHYAQKRDGVAYDDSTGFSYDDSSAVSYDDSTQTGWSE